jgi:putative colanic acid biosynthesis acetyltransferase WcaF
MTPERKEIDSSQFPRFSERELRERWPQSTTFEAPPGEHDSSIVEHGSPPSRWHRSLWWAVWSVLGRTSPRPCHGWRRLLLRLFGSTVGQGAHPYPSCRVWAPWNLTLGPHSCIGDRVDVYSVDRIVLGEWSVVSQDAVLCTATHDYHDPSFPLVTHPITIGDHAWVAAGAFIGPGVTVGEGAVVGARAVVMKHVPPWTVVAGNPARTIGHRQRFLEPGTPANGGRS